KSLDYFNQCLELIKKTENKKIEIKVLNNIGTVYSDLEDYQQALQYFQLGYKKAEEIQDEEAMSILLNNMGIVHFNQGNYEESTKYYQKAIDLALEIRGGQILWEAYLELGKAYTKQKQYEKALESFKNSISIIEDIRSRIKLEELKASYLGTDKRIQAYHNLIHLLVHLHRSNPEKGFHSEAFNYLERAKARAFLDRLEISQVNISTGVNFKLQNREKELMKEISGLYTKLLAAELTPQEKHKIQEKLKSYEDKLETLKREIRTNSPAYADLKYPETITLQETQKNILDKKTAFFAYSIGEEYSYLFVITKNNLNIFPIPPRNKLQDQISDYLKVISDKENHDLQPGYDLYCSLVRPGLKKNLKNLIFVPDDILHFLPFEALITREKKKDWLIEKYRIAYVPSISSYREILQHKKMNKKDPPMNILAFGDPFFGHLETEENGGDIFQNFYSSTAFNFSRLKYSGHEIQGIGSLFKRKKTKFFLRNEATEEQLKEHNLADYKIIHFATHSLIDDQKPARSSIVLSLDEDPKEDGFLQMREVYNLELNADLVVLSACQTGLGQFIKGEGIEGLNRAFFYAGSSAVLMSLWSVNDQASSQLMERFYYHLRSSESIMDALRKTKLEMISSETLSHPFYWAGFIVSGKADEVIFSNRNHTYFFLGLSLLLGIGIIFVAVRKFAS
ncbi:MAG: CHAT domain-containing protein, partial [Candidatus Aminicenantaceae bacterium]